MIWSSDLHAEMVRGSLGEVVTEAQLGLPVFVSADLRFRVIAQFLALDTAAPEKHLLRLQTARQSLLSRIGEQCGIPLRKVLLAATLSFRNIHNSHSLADNFYRRRTCSLPTLTLPSSSMLLLLHSQELPLE